MTSGPEGGRLSTDGPEGGRLSTDGPEGGRASVGTTGGHRLPTFESVLKSRAVEDPVNLWVHRPLAYAFVALVFRTPITPNQITLLALLVGFAAAGCWFVGTPQLMFWGGLLLWTSAILDGADGILARAKQMFSDLGRALDGAADMIVAAVSLAGAFTHLWVKHHDMTHVWLAPIAIATSVAHIELYDFYKESFMKMTNPAWDGRPERVSDAEARLESVRVNKGGLPALIASHMYVGLVTAQTKVVALLDPAGSREHLRFTVNDQTVAAYQRENARVMKLWSLVSLAPHSYLISICGMFDRLDVYLWLRAIGANALFLVILLMQRAASRRTLAALDRLGAAPVPVA
jgi:phosphatidylglycerophosphate synthase